MRTQLDCPLAEMATRMSELSDPNGSLDKITVNWRRFCAFGTYHRIKGRLDQESLDWLKTNFYKTELELGHCLRACPRRAHVSATSS